jgi:hypothetical protein
MSYRKIDGIPIDKHRRCAADNNRGERCRNPAAKGHKCCPAHIFFEFEQPEERTVRRAQVIRYRNAAERPR